MTEIEKMAKDYFEKEEYGPMMEPHILSAYEDGATDVIKLIKEKMPHYAMTTADFFKILETLTNPIQ